MVKIVSDHRKRTEVKEKLMPKNVRETIDKTEIKEELMVRNVKDTTDEKAEIIGDVKETKEEADMQRKVIVTVALDVSSSGKFTIAIRINTRKINFPANYLFLR